MKNSSSQNEKVLYVVVVLLLGVAVFAFLKSESDFQQTSLSSTKSPEMLERVNQHILMTSDQIEIQSLKMQAENQEKAPDLNNTQEQRSYAPSSFLDLTQEQVADELAADLGKKFDDYAFPDSPSEIVHNQIYQNDRAIEEHLEAIERHKEQIMANARARGYEIELNEDGTKIVSWRKIKRSSASELQINSSGGAAR